jgi:hypothetical protein
MNIDKYIKIYNDALEANNDNFPIGFLHDGIAAVVKAAILDDAEFVDNLFLASLGQTGKRMVAELLRRRANSNE